MGSKLAREIQQTKPFGSLEEEAALNLGRTWEFLQTRLAEFLKQYQLTPTQYNMLRILRGAGSDGVTCAQATERMINADPDITRLLDRMEQQSLIQRERSVRDRRVVISRITNLGLDLTNQIDQPLQALLRELLGHAGHPRLRDLIATLEDLRGS